MSKTLTQRSSLNKSNRAYDKTKLKLDYLVIVIQPLRIEHRRKEPEISFHAPTFGDKSL